MTNSETPLHLQDAATLLTPKGFQVSNVWYHGTASGLVPSILEEGLLASGDKESNQKTKKAMTTIGGSYKENKDPIFLTQSRELAYYWAQLTCQSRNQLFGTSEKPEVLAICLPSDVNENVKTDVGVAAMIISASRAPARSSTSG